MPAHVFAQLRKWQLRFCINEIKHIVTGDVHSWRDVSTWHLDGDTESCRNLGVDLPLLANIAAHFQNSWRVVLIGLIEPTVDSCRHIGSFQTQRAGNDVVGKLCRWRHVHIHEYMQVERTQRFHSGALVWPRHHGVSSQSKERTNLPFAFEQNFFSKRRSGCLTALHIDVTHARLRALCEHLWLRRNHSCANLPRRSHQTTWVVHRFAFTVVTTTQGVQNQHQVLGERRVWRHVGPGSGGYCPAWAFCELFGRSNNEFFFDTRTLTDIVERKWIDGYTQLVEAIDVSTTKIFVV